MTDNEIMALSAEIRACNEALERMLHLAGQTAIEVRTNICTRVSILGTAIDVAEGKTAGNPRLAPYIEAMRRATDELSRAVRNHRH